MTAANDISAAAEWLIRLEGQSSPEMWDGFQAWLATDKRHEAAFIRLRTAWTRCDQFKRLRPADGRVDRDLLAQRSTLLSRRQWLVTAGATAASAAGLGWMHSEHEAWTYYETSIGASQITTLADSSAVVLNTNSRLRARLGGERRDIELVRGEALFTVAQDTVRPFHVKTAGALVRALATEFSVRILEDQSTEVLIAAGRIAIGAITPGSQWGLAVLPASTANASAGDSVTVGSNSVVVKRQPPSYIARRLSWTSGRITFDGETLAEAVREFNRYNHRHLSIADPAIASRQVGGSFDATDPESFVAALEKNFGVFRTPAVQGNNDEIRLVSSERRTQPQP